MGCVSAFVVFLPLICLSNILHVPGVFNNIHGDASLQPTPPEGADITPYCSVSTTHGEYAPENRPGARYLPGFTQLTSSSFLLFGGGGFFSQDESPFLCDLWEFSTELTMWRFLKGGYDYAGYDTGVKSDQFGIDVTPPGRQQPCMFPNVLADSESTLGHGWGRVFFWGGYYYSSDLWELDYATLMWRCVHDSTLRSKNPHPGVFHPSNRPGARVANAFWWWGNFWSSNTSNAVNLTESMTSVFFFGGSGIDGDLNDVWELDLRTMSYRLCRGEPGLVDSVGNYGTYTVIMGNETNPNPRVVVETRGQFLEDLDPPARYAVVWWGHEIDELYIFGGRQPLGDVFYNDVWCYSRSRRQWKFVTGTPAIYDLDYNYTSWDENIYTPNRTFHPLNLPTQRRHVYTWQMGPENVLLFGGDKFDTYEIYLMGDLWQFNMELGEFACLQNCGPWNATRDRRYNASFPHLIGGRTGGVTFKTNAGSPALFGGFWAPNDVWSIDGLVDSCRNQSTLESQWLCSTHGECFNDSCSCSGGGGSYSGEDCELWECFGMAKDHPEVCSGHGVCAAADYCVCLIFIGPQCERFTCYLLAPDDESVCHQHGYCAALDDCWCDEDNDWYGAKCEEQIIDATLTSYTNRPLLQITFLLPFSLLNSTEQSVQGFDCALRFPDVSKFGSGPECSWERQLGHETDTAGHVSVQLGEKHKLRDGDTVYVWSVTDPEVSVGLVIVEEVEPPDILAIVFAVFCGVGCCCLALALIVCVIFLVLLIRNIAVSRNLRRQMAMMNLMERPACP